MNEYTEYLLDRLEDEYDYECEQDVEKVEFEVLCNRDSEIFHLIKGTKYLAIQTHWRNGEGHYVLMGGQEVPDIFFNEVE